MFKKIKRKNSIILLLSAYIPMYVVIIIQNIGNLYDKVKNAITVNNIGFIELLYNLKWKKINSYIVNYSEFFIIIIFTLLIIALIALLYKMIERTTDLNRIKITIEEIDDISHTQITNYFAVYILPFITLNLASLTGILVFIFLGYIIGYIYIQNELFYINPIISILFKYNIYKAQFYYKDGEQRIDFEGILLSKKRKKDLKGSEIEVLKGNDDYYFE